MTEDQEKRIKEKIKESCGTGFFIYFFLYFILLASCSGPSSQDIKNLEMKIDKLNCNVSNSKL